MKQGDIVYYVDEDRGLCKGAILMQGTVNKFVTKDKIELGIIRPDKYSKEDDLHFKNDVRTIHVDEACLTYVEALKKILSYFAEKDLYLDSVAEYKKWQEKQEQRQEQRQKSKEYAEKLGFLTLDFVFTFGKFKNCILKDVLRSNPSYICWLHENTEFKVQEEIYKRAKEIKNHYLLPKVENFTDLQVNSWV